MQESLVTRKSEKITYPELPLAIYREIAAHLSQIEGIEIRLLPQNSSEFSYTASQIDGILLEYASDLSSACLKELADILDYYQQVYAPMRRETINI